MSIEAVLILLFAVATAVALASRKLKIPYTVALVGAGLLLGALDLFTPPHLTRELLFAVFLPGLVFEAAYHLQYEDFRRNLLPIVSLAVPGVVASIVLVALVLTPLVGALDLPTPFTWRHALVFGALISATDPIAVVALFKSLGVPRRLGVLMEGESLLNDGTAVVLFSLAVGFAAGEAVAPAGLAVEFVRTVGAGALIGAVLGMAVSEVMKRIDDPMIEITLTTIAAYGSFLVAEHFGFSGVIATVVAGMLCGNYAALQGMSPSTRVAVESFWEYVAFALNSMVFLLIGFEVDVVGFEGTGAALVHSWPPILAAYLAVMLARGLVVGGVTGSQAVLGRPIPGAWGSVLAWGGLRGGISLVLALSLARTFPNRGLIVTMTFGVVVLILAVHGLTISPLLRRLGLTTAHESRERYQRTRGELQVAARALEEIRSLRARRMARPDVLHGIEEEYEARVEEARRQLEALHLAHDELRSDEEERTRRRLLFVEKREILDAYREGVLGHEVYERLLADVDARLHRLDAGRGPGAGDRESGLHATAAEEGVVPAREDDASGGEGEG